MLLNPMTWIVHIVIDLTLRAVRRTYQSLRGAIAWWNRYGIIAVAVALIVLLVVYGIASGKVGWRFKIVTYAVVGVAAATIWGQGLGEWLRSALRLGAMTLDNPS